MDKVNKPLSNKINEEQTIRSPSLIDQVRQKINSNQCIKKAMLFQDPKTGEILVLGLWD